MGDFHYIQNINDIYESQFSLLNPYKHFFIVLAYKKTNKTNIDLITGQTNSTQRRLPIQHKKMLNRYNTANKYSSDLGKTENWISMASCYFKLTSNYRIGGEYDLLDRQKHRPRPSTLGNICVLGANKL